MQIICSLKQCRKQTNKKINKEKKYMFILFKRLKDKLMCLRCCINDIKNKKCKIFNKIKKKINTTENV